LRAALPFQKRPFLEGLLIAAQNRAAISAYFKWSNMTLSRIAAGVFWQVKKRPFEMKRNSSHKRDFLEF
jgi:hypothetical protein